jgi:hypothetical protein
MRALRAMLVLTRRAVYRRPVGGIKALERSPPLATTLLAGERRAILARGKTVSGRELRRQREQVSFMM